MVEGLIITYFVGIAIGIVAGLIATIVFWVDWQDSLKKARGIQKKKQSRGAYSSDYEPTDLYGYTLAQRTKKAAQQANKVLLVFKLSPLLLVWPLVGPAWLLRKVSNWALVRFKEMRGTLRGEIV